MHAPACGCVYPQIDFSAEGQSKWPGRAFVRSGIARIPMHAAVCAFSASAEAEQFADMRRESRVRSRPSDRTNRQEKSPSRFDSGFE
jgi:hypothetical protein